MNNFERNFSEQELIRREKLKELQTAGQDPYKNTKWERTHKINELVTKFQEFTKPELAEMQQDQIVTAGRIRLFREAGKKAAFANIQDQDGQIQLYLRQDVVGEEKFEMVRNYDLGDIIGVKGKMMKTDHGEITIRVEEVELLTKALKPLPDKHAGLNDIEEQYRRRYVDLIVNPEKKEVFTKRSRIIRKIQEILDHNGYFEVETPILQSVRGGAAAKPFVTHYNALDNDFYLRIATELHLKRCIVGGFDGVYEIGRLFRNEGMDARHNPEFTTIEIYVAYQDVYFIMDLNERIFRECAQAVNGTTKINYGGVDFDLGKPFKRWHMVDAVKEITGVDFWKDMSYDEAVKIAKEHNIKVEKHHFSIGHIINLFFEEFVEEKIVEPTFIFGHPKEISPLAKLNDKDPRFTDRYELFILGREYANAFSELNNPIDQFERFADQLKEAEFGNDEANDMDIDFIEALEYGLPPTVGIGIGIDRMVMFLTNSESIKDVLLFPQMKPRG
jgi:lysyl-tRNA synthetase class 2